ncbi:MAG: CHASE2 domain-containing protein, partial [Merismopedia sp. SIO2A8]|nr:CHASE2 domain-containing protein [Merismopedia sp. SIO2A8]
AERCADGDGAVEAAPGAVAKPGDLSGDLVHRLVREAEELDLGDGHHPRCSQTQFVAALKSMDTVIGAESVVPDQSGTVIAPPPALPIEQVGFVDALLDADGNQRRSLLGAKTIDGSYQFSMAIRLASAYLAPHGIILENGIRDPVAMRFDSVEIPVITPNFGGYARVDAGGNQTLINFRSGPHPFRVVTLTEVLADQGDAAWFRDRIVLIGITANSSKYGADVAQSTAVTSPNPGLVFGVEIQAHATSQLINAVLEGRSLLHTWPDGWEYTWILFWGLLGMGVGRVIRKLGWHLVIISAFSIGLVGIGYGSLLGGWWIPIAPALGVFLLNGVVLHAFYLYNHSLQSRIRDRQRVIEQTFTAIHNGPLQTLATLLRELDETEKLSHAAETETIRSPQSKAPDVAVPYKAINARSGRGAVEDVDWGDDSHPPNFLAEAVEGEKENRARPWLDGLQEKLQQLNQDLRGIYVGMQEEVLQGNRLYLPGQTALDLATPLHELLYEIYNDTLQRHLPNFEGIRVKVVKFEPFEEVTLSPDQKRDLCRFLEEALCNVGKHAEGTKRLVVDCLYDGTENVIRVVDNGVGDQQGHSKAKSAHASRASKRKGRGSQQALNLAAQLGGIFERSPQSPNGMRCELRWQPKRSLWHQVRQQIKTIRDPEKP